MKRTFMIALLICSVTSLSACSVANDVNDTNMNSKLMVEAADDESDDDEMTELDDDFVIESEKENAIDEVKINPEIPELEENEIILGSYEQDGNVENGREVLVWRVLATEGNKKLVVSKYSLYNEYFTHEEYSTWEDSDIREELNTKFYNEVFTDEEKSQILLSEIDNEVVKERLYNFVSEGTVEDYIFLLSVSEIEKYFEIDNYGFNGLYLSSSDLLVANVKSDAQDNTDPFDSDLYELGYKDFYPESVIGVYATPWYTRTTVEDGISELSGPAIMVIDRAGSAHPSFFDWHYTVRPAMWIEVEE